MSDQQQYRYMTVDDMKSLGDDSRLDVTNDEKHEYRNSMGNLIYHHKIENISNNFYFLLQPLPI